VLIGHARALFIQARALQAPASAHGDTGHVADRCTRRPVPRRGDAAMQADRNHQ
jgi:hypothetical protein